MSILEAKSFDGPFSAAQISHADIADFATDCVNVTRQDVEDYREQLRRLREQLDKYTADHTGYSGFPSSCKPSKPDRIPVSFSGSRFCEVLNVSP